MSFTEFYCDYTNGNNLRSGSSLTTTPYTKTAGNWTQTGRIYTVTDGSNPSTDVSVGDFASIYADGSSPPTNYVARVLTVQNAINGSITMDTTAEAGAAPTDGTGNRTIVVGGVWKGPNGISGFPFTMQGLGNITNVSGDQVRVNMKNNATYSITTGFTVNTSSPDFVMQGYSSSPGDSQRAIIDGGSSTGLVMTVGIYPVIVADLIFSTSVASGTQDLVSSNNPMSRCVFRGARGNGLIISGGMPIISCEAYQCNKSNSVGKAGFRSNGSFTKFINCYSHDHTSGANAHAFVFVGSAEMLHCIADTYSGDGVNISGNNNAAIVYQCDFYNGTGSAIVSSDTSRPNLYVQNCNFISNGRAINNSGGKAFGYVRNCGYGSGTASNINSDILGPLIKELTVTYPADKTPWVDPDNGDFRINLKEANATGWGQFTETDPNLTKPNSVGYPDIGAVQSKTGPGGTFGKEVSYGFPQ